MSLLPRFHTRRTNLNGVRHYSCDGHVLPSVTAVLSETEDKSWLSAWRERIGHAEADRISREASELGTRTHSLVENYLLDKHGHKQLSLLQEPLQAPPEGSEDESLLQAFKPFLDEVQEVLLLEGTVWWIDDLGKGFAGSFDALIRWQDRLWVCDWKTTRKQKNRGDWGRAFCQCSAYGQAIQQRYGLEVEGGLVVSVNRGNLRRDVHQVSEDELELYWEAFTSRLNAYERGEIIA